MKKYIVFLVLSVCCIQTNAQITTPTLTPVATDQSIFSAHKGSDILTFYLKREQYAPLSTGVYSVKGTMNDSATNRKKSVVGMYDGASLTLYEVQSPELETKLLSFDFKGTPRDRIEALKNYPSFVSKLIFMRTDKGIEGSFTTSNTVSPLYMHLGSIAIAKEQQILKLNTKNSIDLLQLSRFYKDVEIFAFNKNNILLLFSAPSTQFSNGRCAAGEETGISWLRFSTTGSLEDVQMVVMESCLIDITTDDAQKEGEDIIHYTIVNYNNTTKKKVTVNLKEVSLTIVPLKE